MSQRETLLVGSIPGQNNEDAMTQALDELAPHLRYLPDGETGERDAWVVGIVNNLRSHPDLEVRKEGSWANYKDQLNYKVASGHKLRGDSLDLGHVAAYQDSWPVFERLRQQYRRSDLAFQVGLPGAFDLALFAMGMTGPFRHRQPFADALIDEIEQIYSRGGDDVIFQFEIPAELVFVTKAPGPLQDTTARWLGGAVADLAARAPRGARFGVHLCLGDLGHRALARMKDTRPLVRLANAITRKWPARRPLEYVHAPLAAGEDPPPLEPGFYRPLNKLDIPDQTRFVAGLLHENRKIAELRSLLGHVETHLDETVDVAAACGLARRGRTAAQQVMRQAATLCDASTT